MNCSISLEWEGLFESYKRVFYTIRNNCELVEGSDEEGISDELPKKVPRRFSYWSVWNDTITFGGELEVNTWIS
jgi:hypothetical protein